MRSNWTTQEIDAFIRTQFAGKLRIVPYWYPLVFEDFADETIQNKTLQISANADFILFEVSFIAEIDDTIAFPAGLNLLITDTGSSSQYTQSPVPLDQFASAQYFTRNLSYPRKVGGRTALSVQVQNNSGDDIDSLDLNFAGILVFGMNG